MIEDAKEALRKYGETLDIRREFLQPLLREGSEVSVSRVRLVYEGGVLKPRNVKMLEAAVDKTKETVPGVEVLFQ
jgi:CBS-domain-containing membrane protein